MSGGGKLTGKGFSLREKLHAEEGPSGREKERTAFEENSGVAFKKRSGRQMRSPTHGRGKKNCLTVKGGTASRKKKSVGRRPGGGGKKIPALPCRILNPATYHAGFDPGGATSKAKNITNGGDCQEKAPPMEFGQKKEVFFKGGGRRIPFWGGSFWGGRKKGGPNSILGRASLCKQGLSEVFRESHTSRLEKKSTDWRKEREDKTKHRKKTSLLKKKERRLCWELSAEHRRAPS